MIEGGSVITEIIIMVLGFLGVVLGVTLFRKTLDKLLVMVVSLILFFGGTICFFNKIDEELYVGRPATIKDIKLNKVFVLNKILGDDLLLIRSVDNPKEIDERIVNLPISEPKIGNSYPVIEIKGERFIMPYTPPQKKTLFE